MQLTCSTCASETTVVTLDGSVTCPNCGTPLSGSSENDPQYAPTRMYQRGDSGKPDDRLALVEPGTSFGNYRVVRRVAQGGCGVVYKARDEQLQIDVAIKMPHIDLDGRLAELLLEEARLVAKLRHTNIVRVLTADTDVEGNVYIAMDWIEGRTLRDVIAEGQISIDRAVETMIKVAAAIHAAHQAGYVHRDLKPANILIDDAGEPYVTDFGLAISESNQREHSDEFAGTINYMSPEQVRAETQYLDGRTDVWALGVILYELLTGRKPFSGDPQQVLDEICNREPKPIRLLNDEVDERLIAVVEGCLRKDVAQRTATAGQVRDALAASRQHELDNPQSPSVRNIVLLTTGMLGCLLLAFAAIRYFPSDQTHGGGPEGAVADSARPVANTDDAANVDGNRRTAGEGQPHNADDAARLPGPSQRTFASAKWNKLLDRPLEKLLWPGPESNSSIVPDTDLESLTLLVNGSAFLKAGQTESGRFHLRAIVDQPGWAGGFGIFYGLKPIDGGYECERISLFRQSDRFGKASYRLDRDSSTLDADFRITRTVGRSSSPISYPGKREELLLKFEDNQLSDVSWGDEESISRLIKDSRPDVPPIDCVGSFGLSLESSSATISQFRIFLD